jgi:hypothetical protein
MAFGTMGARENEKLAFNMKAHKTFRNELFLLINIELNIV